MYREAIRAALDAIAEIPETDSLRPIAFQEVLRASLASRTSPRVEESRPHDASEHADDPSARLSQRLGLGIEVVQRVFDFEGGTPTLTIGSNRLPNGKSPATQQIALLICAARQAGMGETETAAEVIRRTCEEFGRLDDPNFAATIRQIGGLLIQGGTPRARTYRLSRPGYDRVRSLVEALGSAQ